MQAIQVLENAALEAPRQRSPFRALVWKEWRQQRWIFLSLAGLAYTLLVVGLVMAHSDRHATQETGGALVGCSILLGAIGVVILSANAFSGERDDETDLFLETIPCSRGRLFWVKLGAVLFLVLLALFPAGTGALVSFGSQPDVSSSQLELGAVLTVLVVAAIVLGLATIPALVASFGGSVIATILASLPVIGACWAYVYSPSVLLSLFVPTGSRKFWNVCMAALFGVLLLGTILLAARRMWIRVERTWRRSLRTAAVAASLLIACVAIPAAVAYVYVTFFAPLSFFQSGNSYAIDGRISSASPDGKYVTFEAYYAGWGPDQAEPLSWKRTRGGINGSPDCGTAASES